MAKKSEQSLIRIGDITTTSGGQRNDLVQRCQNQFHYRLSKTLDRKCAPSDTFKAVDGA
jgi:hypothetical protein